MLKEKLYLATSGYHGKHEKVGTPKLYLQNKLLYWYHLPQRENKLIQSESIIPVEEILEEINYVDCDFPAFDVTYRAEEYYFGMIVYFIVFKFMKM